MSVVTFLLGQCGNQLGTEILDAIVANDNNHGRAQEIFFRGSKSTKDRRVARAVLVDMEPRVVAQARQYAASTGTWSFDESCSFTRQSGSGNNWAYGYTKHGPSSWDHVSDLLRREVEQCDRLDGFLFVQSLAGGTGSGVGAYMTDCVRDEFKSASILNTVVWPYHTGEVVVQNYNSLLTLSHLSESSDGLLVVHNENMSSACRRLLGIARPSFQDLNRAIASNVVNVVLPSTQDLGGGYKRPTMALSDPLQHLCAHPSYRLLTMYTIPQMPKQSVAYSVFQWSALLKRLAKMVATDAIMDADLSAYEGCSRVNKCVANVLYLRGAGLRDPANQRTRLPSEVELLRESHLYTPWMAAADPLLVCSNRSPVNNYEMSAALLSNCQSVAAPLDRMLDRAYTMLVSKAYVHQYAQHGCDDAFFKDRFLQLDQIVYDYRHL